MDNNDSNTIKQCWETAKHVPNLFEALPFELLKLIGSYVISHEPIKSDQIAGYVLVAKHWFETLLSGPIRIKVLPDHAPIALLNIMSAFSRLSIRLDLRSCQRVGNVRKSFLDITRNNIYELDMRDIKFSFDIKPVSRHLRSTSLKRLALCQTYDRPLDYTFVSKLVALESITIEQTLGRCARSDRLDLNYFTTLTNLKELAISYSNECTIIDSVTNLTSLQTLILTIRRPCLIGGKCDLDGDIPLDFTKLTALTRLKTLLIDEEPPFGELTFNETDPFRQYYVERIDREYKILKSLKCHLNLQRIYYRGEAPVVATLIAYDPLYKAIPIEKFQVGETLVVDNTSDHLQVEFTYK